MKIKDRIVELRRVPARELLPNPRNWRTHPEHQQNAMRGVLADIGIADAMIARETPDGLMLIDGHLRTELLDQDVPVLILDVTEAEADRLLVTLDPLAALASVDKEQLESLLVDMPEFDNADVNQMLIDLSIQAGIALSDWDSPIVDPESIGSYNPDEETGIIRIKCQKEERDTIAAVITKALEKFSHDLKVF